MYINNKNSSINDMCFILGFFFPGDGLESKMPLTQLQEQLRLSHHDASLLSGFQHDKVAA